MSLAGKTVFITGAAKRIGAEIARYFARNGASVCIHYNSSKKEALGLKKEIENYGVKVKLYKCDLTNTKSAIKIFKKAVSDFGKIEFLINNASTFKRNLIGNANIEEFERDFSIHTKTPFFLMQSFAKQKFENEEGLIINIVDANVSRKFSNFTTYMLSKKSLLELTTFAAFEFAPLVRVNAIMPGFIMEEETAFLNDEYYKKKHLKIPLNRKGSVEDIISTLDFIISNTYINGESIKVDGGSSIMN